MRVCRLDLLGYGHFSNHSLEFPEGGHDFHIIVGANEAGKSTARSALEDALFGIHPRSAFGFRHGYKGMMVGALIEHEGRRLSFRRRKGKANTLLDSDGQPLADNALRFFLERADRNRLERMFSLSHERLRSSAQELANPHSETAAMIFGAATGTEEVAAHIRVMKEKAGQLFTPTKGSTRVFDQLVERFKDAKDAVSSATVTGDDWKRAEEEANEARAHLADLRNQRSDLFQAHERLNRIRLVYPDLKRKKELLARLAELGEVPFFADDVLEVLQEAEREVLQHDATIGHLEDQIASESEAAASITIANALLESEREINRLAERNIELQPQREDLPKRRRELAEVAQRLRDRARDLGLEDVQSRRVPAPHAVARLRKLSNEWIDLGHACDLLRQTAVLAGKRTRNLERRLEAMGPTLDVGPLRAALQAIDGAADPEAARKAAEREHREAASRSEACLRPLLTLVGDGDRLAGLWVPPVERVQELRDGLKEAADRRDACRDKLASVESELTLHEAQRKKLAAEGELVTIEEIEILRQARDEHLETVRTCLVSGRGDLEGDSLGDLEGAIRRADEAADRRLHAARTLARLEEIDDAMSSQSMKRTSLEAQHDGHERSLRALHDIWNDLFRDLPGNPLDPDAMLKWLNDRQTALQAFAEEGRAARDLAACLAEERRVRELLMAEAAALAMQTDGLASRPLSVVRSLVARHCDALRDTNRKRADLVDELETARDEEREAATALAEREADMVSLREAWNAAGTELDVVGPPDHAGERLRIIEEMRSDVDLEAELKHRRIGKMERDLEAFASDVACLAKAVGEEPGTRDPGTVIRDLAQALSGALEKQQRLQSRKESMAEKQRQLEEMRRARGAADMTIRGLMASAGVEDLKDLHRAIARAHEVRGLGREVGALTERLARNGDGRSEEELEGETRDIDPDRLTAEIDSISDRLKELEDPMATAAVAERQATETLKSIDGSDAAIAAAWDREAIRAELEDLAVRYVRAQTGFRLLQWAVNRHRTEQQAPLLKRASALFANLTQGSFSGLDLVYNEKDQAVLAGVRGDGSNVDVTGMSDGTLDQLWLALKLSAIHGWLEGNAALPFIADDLFVNFDDARVGAGLEALHHLAGSCQVLVFTHHVHLVALARQVLCDGVSVISLDTA